MKRQNKRWLKVSNSHSIWSCMCINLQKVITQEYKILLEMIQQIDIKGIMIILSALGLSMFYVMYPLRKDMQLPIAVLIQLQIRKLILSVICGFIVLRNSLTRCSMNSTLENTKWDPKEDGYTSQNLIMSSISSKELMKTQQMLFKNKKVLNSY